MAVPGQVTDPSAVEARDITVAAPDGPLPAWLARPRGDAPRPAMLVIHEAYGVNDHIRDVCRRFAAAGFDALAPQLFDRVGGPPPMGDVPAIMAKLFALDDAQTVRDLDACAAHLRALDGASGKLGCAGFCMGGRVTLLFACSSGALDAAVDCWGGFIDRATPDDMTTPRRPTPVMDLGSDLSCPVLLVGGADDGNPSPAVLRELHARLVRAGKDATLHVFDGAGHAFFADYRPNYREAQAFALWDEMLAFLRRHLA